MVGKNERRERGSKQETTEEQGKFKYNEHKTLLSGVYLADY